MTTNKHQVILVDLDGTLAFYDRWRGLNSIGHPIPAMAERVRAWLAEGHEVRIFTARADPSVDPEMLSATLEAIVDWTLLWFGCVLPVTNQKTRDVTVMYDDRARQVEENTGQVYNAIVAGGL